MTVLQLKEMLERVPNNAVVIVAHELVGSQQYAEDVEYLRNNYYSDGYDGALIIHELPKGDHSE